MYVDPIVTIRICLEQLSSSHPSMNSVQFSLQNFLWRKADLVLISDTTRRLTLAPVAFQQAETRLMANIQFLLL